MTDYKIAFEASLMIPTLWEHTFQNVINNELVSTSKTRQAINPSTEEPLWDAPMSTQEHVDKAVAAARAALPAWRKLSQDERAEYLNRFADAIEANKQEFIDLLGKEVGKPPQAAGLEMFLTMGIVRETPKLRLKEEKPEDNEDRTAIVRYVPIGVCVGIVPWNFPLLLSAGKLFPALLAGNTLILKPSPYSPYSALKLAELGTKIFPPGVVQALSGEENLGPMVTAHPGVNKISFTGSVSTGKKVMAACANTVKRVTLELGGNDAAIICDDVDIEKVVSKVAFFAFLHTGQICMNTKRIYVHEKIYDAFMAAMVEFVKQSKVGDYTDSEAFLGPVQNKMQYEKLQNLYSQIGKEGWKVAFGGAPEEKSGKGCFLPPTIIDNPPEDSRIVVEEPFGPIVPVLKWNGDEDDVIKRANASEVGLGASVWSKDVEKAKRIAEQLEAGNIWVNTHFELAPNVPFGGHKQSGLGVEWGELGLKGWCNPQSYWIKHSGV